VDLDHTLYALDSTTVEEKADRLYRNISDYSTECFIQLQETLLIRPSLIVKIATEGAKWARRQSWQRRAYVISGRCRSVRVIGTGVGVRDDLVVRVAAEVLHLKSHLLVLVIGPKTYNF
jgi:hypothetical protein